MTAQPPKLVPCPGCGGNGSCITCKGLGEVTEGTTKSERDGRLVRAEAERDEWREIANLFISVMIDADHGSPDMRRQSVGPWGNVPPQEIIGALQAAGPDGDLGETIRAAVLGRAWRMRGKLLEGTCNYPLCPNRPTTPEERKKYIADNRLATVGLRRPGDTREVAVLSVCAPGRRAGRDHVADDECKAWAVWVAARFSAGRIALKPRA